MSISGTVAVRAPSRRVGDVLPLAGVLALFLVAVAITGPFGDFPLNDDWSFGITARRLAQTGVWDPTNFPSMPLITNALWAWPFCRLTACSFDALRASTLVAAVGLGVATFALLRPRTSPLVASLGTAAMLFNPIGYALSFTFMTDVLFWALFTASAVAFVASLERDSVPFAALGTAIAVAATLSRQLAPAVPLAYGIVRLMQGGPWPRRLAMSVLPVALCAGALLAFDHWLLASGKVSAGTAQADAITQSIRTPVLLVKRVAENLTTALLYTGLFSLPVLLVTRRPADDTLGRWGRLLPRLAGAAAVLLAAATMAAAHRMMPFGKNVLVPEGIGPLTLRDTFVMNLPDVPQLPRVWWSLLTLGSLAGIFPLVDRMAVSTLTALTAWRRGRLGFAHATVLLALLSAAAYTAPLVIVSAYDRYFVATLPLVFLLLATASVPRPVPLPRAAASAAVTLILCGFAAAATHDYLAWNRARWTATASLVGTPPSEIDGGVEYDALNSFGVADALNPDRSFRWVSDAAYVVSFGPIDGMTVAGTTPYRTWLPPFDRTVLVLQRATASEAVRSTAAETRQ